MNLIDIVQRDVYCLFEIRYGDLIKLKKVLDHTEVTIDMNTKENQEAVDYLNNKFYPEITKTLKGINIDTQS